jgi:hypothetical protein
MRYFFSHAPYDQDVIAYLSSEIAEEDQMDPMLPRPSGWRLVIERSSVSGEAGLIRSTWMETIDEAVRQVELYWDPLWTDSLSGSRIELQLR